ncbi:MAG: SMC-Scp complex subunit ScpB [Phycisphaerales bacterium]|nr:SMC-Scp complex subunit ScpB [Phycisphaerae bacterium]NNF42545.1 SMC-Scp complex subunit ScpB [Phycisphaerales bacterium]NNM25087.1 SMC-Scp complex subunit ScpB [Phycisphaerales bacterium]
MTAEATTVETAMSPDHDAEEVPASEVPLEARVEAVLFGTERPLPDARLAEVLGIEAKGAAKRIKAAIESLNESYEQTGRTFRAERLAGGWQLLTEPAFGPLLARLHRDRQQSRLSPAAMETLAIIAYRQPIIRAEIEAIRGVSCGEVLRGLLERRLVKIVGRAEELGRPMLYGTTREFLNVFGLASPTDLPAVEGLEPSARAPWRPKPAPAAESEGDASGASEISDATDATDPTDPDPDADAPTGG